MGRYRKGPALLLGLILGISLLSGCQVLPKGKRIVRISHGQSETHPEHIGLLAFREYIEERLGDRYQIEIFPNEILGSSQKAIELAQTGAIDFVVSATANLETFAPIYEIFSMPYLFASEEDYYKAMEDRETMEEIYESTEDSGFQVLTWYSAGTRNFYAKTPIHTPDDLVGKKIRVQQSPASVGMVQAFGAAATPMSFGEVYTAIQQGVIDGAENNTLALVNNKHGEVAKYFSMNHHQMVPDVLLCSQMFLEDLTEEEEEIFQEAALFSTQVELQEWERQEKKARQVAEEDLGVTFLEVDIEAFRQKVLPLHEVMMQRNPDLRPIYYELTKEEGQ